MGEPSRRLRKLARPRYGVGRPEERMPTRTPAATMPMSSTPMPARPCKAARSPPPSVRALGTGATQKGPTSWSRSVRPTNFESAQRRISAIIHYVCLAIT